MTSIDQERRREQALERRAQKLEDVARRKEPDPIGDPIAADQAFDAECRARRLVPWDVFPWSEYGWDA
jgi:hypothetical protein